MALVTYLDLVRYINTFDLEGSQRLREVTAPGTPAANSLFLYAADKSSVSNLYWKSDAGVTYDLSLASPGNIALMSQVFRNNPPLRVREGDITLIDNTRNNVTTSKHGFTPKLPNDAAKFLDGTGAYTVPKGDPLVAQVFGRLPQRHANIDHAPAGTPSTQAFSDTATVGTSLSDSKSDHKHAMPADPVTAHVAAGDPHTGYRLESADHSHESTGLQGGQIDEDALALTDVTTNNSSLTKHGFLQKLPGGTTNFLRADGTFAAPAAGATDFLVVQVFS